MNADAAITVLHLGASLLLNCHFLFSKYFTLLSVNKAWVNKTKKMITNPKFIIRLREDKKTTHFKE